MRLSLAFLFLLAITAPAFAQNQGQIVPSGSFTPGHTIRCQNSTCTVAQDSGGSAGSNKNGQGYLTELGITNTGTPFCINDALTNAVGGYHQFCFGANSLGGGLIAYNPVGGASVLPLQFNVNGSTYQFPFTSGNVVGPVSSTINDVPSFNNTVGSLLADSGVAQLSSAGIQYSADGSGNLFWLANAINQKTITGTHSDQETTQAILRTTTGSGTNGPSQSDAALTVGANKLNYKTSAAQGEIDPLWIYGGQGKLGDGDAITAQYISMDDGGGNPNYGRNLFEGVNQLLTTTAGNAVITQIDMRYGSVITSPTVAGALASVGYTAEAQVGPSDVAFLADSCDLSSGSTPCGGAGSNSPYWKYLLEGRVKRSELTTGVYARLGTAAGFSGGTTTLLLRGLGASASVIQLDSVTSGAPNNFVQFLEAGTAKWDVGLLGSDHSFRILDATGGTVTIFQADSSDNVSLGTSGKAVTILGTLTVPASTTGAVTPSFTNAPTSCSNVIWLGPFTVTSPSQSNVYIAACHT